MDGVLSELDSGTIDKAFEHVELQIAKEKAVCLYVYDIEQDINMCQCHYKSTM